MDIGARLKRARESIGYTLDKVEQESGIGKSSISEFENNKREPKFSQLSRLAEVYKRAIEFFFADEPPIDNIMLWRETPSIEGEKEKIEAEFRQLCHQYRNLEVVMNEVKENKLPELEIECEKFSYKDANDLAEETQRRFLLGDVPCTSLKHTLEEKFYVKIFHLAFSGSGSAISTVSQEFGPAILLNSASKLWRRNFDLAHELFHILTWKVFRSGDFEGSEPSKYEEKLANAFASRLLLPTDVVKGKIESGMNEKRQIGLELLDEIAREFGVSTEALLWRLLYLYNKPVEEVEKCVEQAKSLRFYRPDRRSDEPDKLPERYCSLAIRALGEGKLSLIQFAKYMGISYKQAEEYLMDEGGFKDEEVSISVA